MTTPATTPADGELLIAAKRLLDAVDAEMSDEWECNSYHPSLRPAADALRSALATPSPGKAPEPVAWKEPEEWQSRYMGDPRQPGYWFSVRRDAWDWAKDVYEKYDNHTNKNGWEVRPLYASPGKAEVERWMPIESAPKDGSMFLCWVSAVRHTRIDGEFGLPADVSEPDFCQWNANGGDGYWDNMMGQIGDEYDVTHWMPLPSAPGAIQHERDK